MIPFAIAALDELRTSRTARVFTLLCAALVVLTAAGAYAMHRYRQMELALQRAGLAAANAVAAADTVRRQALTGADSIQVLGSKLAAVSRYALQETQRGDSLDRALGQERKLRATLQATIAASHTHTSAPVEETATSATDSTTGAVTDPADVSRRASFQVRDAPYTANATVVLPPPPGAGTLDLRIHLDPARIDLHAGCSAPDAAGIRQASITAAGPAWLRLAVTTATQDPAICNAGRAGTGAERRGHATWVDAALMLGAALLGHLIP